ncbi:aspartate--tRNA ligase 1 [Clostridium sp. CAG:609]|nr:aspartate--tRNA ligase 1 [Clostridium sp. CAG:609]
MKGNMYRDIYCGEVDSSYIGKEIKLAGWVNSVRNLGNLVFITLRDETGIVQLITESSEYKTIHKEATVTVSGKVLRRTPDMVNKNMKTGEVEVEISSLEVLGDCINTLPFEINKSKESNEDTRLKYRYLDLRNEEVHNNIIFRSKVIDFIRSEMKGMDFLEVQTPIITATSPEGARDFIIPSRKFAGKFYALPQSPQIFKQLLMVSGFNKYFQIAPCFRDEDPRSDRLYGEFYQLDFEMSFATDEDVYKVGEKVFYDVFTKFSDKYVSPAPFRRIKFKDAILKYGSDKPDLRNPLIIEDITEVMNKTDFAPFKNTTVRCIKVENIEKSNSWYKSMEEYVKGIHGNLGYIQVKDNMELKSSLAKFMSDEVKNELIEKMNLHVGDALFIVADKNRCARIMGNLRTKLGNELNLIDKDRYEFCIVNDFPFYEENEETGAIEFSHNPFSMPKGGLDALNNKNPFEIEAYQYDFVCNGYEMASGGVRNHSPEVLKKAFALVGYDEDVVRSKFPSLYEAFKYGAPPHAGMAPGLDRIIMLLKNEENIREIVPFPIGANGADAMMGCPGEAFPEQLKEAHIKIDN